MNNLIEYINELTPYAVDKDHLFKFLYNRKIQASTFYFKLLTCSRLDRENYLQAFMEEEIYELDDKGNLVSWMDNV